MGKQHAPGFLRLVDEAKGRIRQLTIHQVKSWQDEKRPFELIDVREDREWQAGRLPGAIHLGKGVIERDVEKTVPARDRPIVLYCGGGFRSALAADSLKKMGFTHVWSMDGGFGAWQQAGWPVDMDPL